jgi:preprotein translocase subunit SecA
VLTEEGVLHAEKLLGGIENLYESRRTWTCSTPSIRQSARARLYKHDVDYVVKDGEVIIVDEFTGRLMPGRRWSDGLHQAVEAKEGVKIEAENQTLATITFQNYFRMYDKLAGMTGTADTEAAEFDKIYKLEVIVIPPNRRWSGEITPDLVYRTERREVRCDRRTRSRRSTSNGTAGARRHDLDREVRADLLDAQAAGCPARRAQRQVPRARGRHRGAGGRKNAVTIATNMAGRGTDILLGGNPEYAAAQKTATVEDPLRTKRRSRRRFASSGSSTTRRWSAGGLHIIGTERHESRRIDNQLRGRSGTSGRSRLIALLSLARRRPDAHLRFRSRHRA